MPRYDTTWLVAGELMAVGRVAVEAAAYMLGINPPQIRWLIERPNGGDEWRFECAIQGFCSADGKTIFLRRNLSPFAVADVAVHEVRHSFQIQNGMRERISTRHLERDAELFQMEFWKGSEQRNGTSDDILRELMRRKIETAIRSRSKPTKKKDLVFSAHYPARGQTRVIAPSDEEMRESVLRYILNGND